MAHKRKKKRETKMTSGYLLESDYLEAIKMTSITTAKMEKLDEKTEIEEGNFDKKESEECTKINTAIVAKGEYVDVCKMARDNVYKVEFVKNCVKVGPQNLEGPIVKGGYPVKEYTEEEYQVIKGEYTEVEASKHLPLTIHVTHLDQVCFFYIEDDAL